MTARAKSLSKAQKEEVRQLAAQGMRIPEIAKRFPDHPWQVINGTVTTARRIGRIPKIVKPEPPGGFASPPSYLTPAPEMAAQALHPISVAPLQTEEPVTNPPPPVQPPAQRPAGQAVASSPGWDPASFGFNFTVSQNPSEALSTNTGQPMFRVERTAPPHGHLGTHLGYFDPEKLANRYGSGTYRISLRLPGHPRELMGEYIVSENYGQPKFPARDGEHDERERTRQARPQDPFRGWSPGDGYFRGYEASQRAAPVVVTEAAASEAIRQMGELQRSFLTREAEDRKTGPSAFLQGFVREQDSRWMQIRTEERDKEEQRRVREEADRKREREEREADRKRERQERDDQWKKDRDAAEDQHRREMDRIRADETKRDEREKEHQQFILKLEQEKISLITKEMETRESRLKTELESKRKDSDREIDAARKDMESLEQSVKEQIASGKKDLERECSFRKEMLEKEHALIKDKLAREEALLKEKLELQTQIATANTTDSLVKGAQQLVGELRKGLDSIFTQRRLEMGIGPGNVTTIPERSAASDTADRSAAAQQPQTEGSEMPEDFITQLMKDANGKIIVSEWARQVAAQVPPGSFLGFFMDGYQDPVDHAFRKACRVFSVYIRTRSWGELRASLDPHLSADEKKAFANDWAEEFYEAFRGCFFEEVDGFWKGIAERNAARSQAPAEPAKEEAKA
jgi:hypothetical protein